MCYNRTESRTGETMIDRLETILEKYNNLEIELTKPEVLSDIKKTKEYSKEMANLEEVVTEYKKYKKILAEIEDTREMTKDPELRCPECKQLFTPRIR